MKNANRVAKEILTTAATQVKSWGEGGNVNDVLIIDDGEVIVVYGGTSNHGYGTFFCPYFPLDAAKTILNECEKLFDAFTIEVTNKETGEIKTEGLSKMPKKNRAELIKIMAECAVLYIIAHAGKYLSDSLEETVFFISFAL
jgi:hypothetical protein